MTLVAIALIVMVLVGARIASSRTEDRRTRFCDLMVEAFDAGDDRDAATELTNRARKALNPSRLSDPASESHLARDWWYRRHGDGFLHGESNVDGAVDDLPRDAPATTAIGRTADQLETDLRTLCADADS